ncbi:Protein kinase essential for the initiation of DNA replication [Phaffia rhodozyma]|uniref:Protein kinase essential for the initiation of DNA replication n=1 Tax=Phaffia rhodozyma TaxID=264483 RepID=A0A0F7SGT2_PHARH|nr:Protein kinase essential for the initiation of DNA replication [Phaffia rhodozyma]
MITIPRSPVLPPARTHSANPPTPEHPPTRPSTINASAPPRMAAKVKPNSITPLKRAAASASRWGDREKENISHNGALINSIISAGVTKKLKTVNGSAVPNYQTLPTSTPRKPLGRCPDTSTAAGPSTTAVSVSTASASTAGLTLKKDKEAKMALLQKEEEEFVTKYAKAFPSFVFHFDSVEPGVYGPKLMELGGRIDKFFSRHVTHVITCRPIPVLSEKQLAPPSPATLARRNSNIGTADRGLNARSKVLANPFLDETGQSDVLAKALTFKMKVWDVEKFHSVINRLLPADSPARKPSLNHHRKTSVNSNLSHLLEDEKIHGTRERDLTAPRANHHYFSRGSYYVLCEDATGEYRTILAREYEKPRNGEVPDWPVLHGNFLKCPPVPPPQPAQPRIKPEPAHPPQNSKPTDRPIANIPSHLTTAARLRGEGANGDLRRSVSLNNLGRSNRNPFVGDNLARATTAEVAAAAAAEADNNPAYMAASGNSVNITSAITSQQSGTGHGQGGTTGLLAMRGREKRIAELNKRVVPMAAGASRGPFAATSEAIKGLCPTEGAITDLSSAAPVLDPLGRVPTAPSESASHASTTTATGADNVTAINTAKAREEDQRLDAKVLADHVYRNVQPKKEPTVTIVEPVRSVTHGRMDPPPIKKRHSLPGNFERREKERVRLPVREETKKPGYCENCRVKFDDFSVHVISRKHRRFALDDRHFQELDTVLDRLERPPWWAADSAGYVSKQRWSDLGGGTAIDGESEEEEQEQEQEDEEDDAIDVDEEDGEKEEVEVDAIQDDHAGGDMGNNDDVGLTCGYTADDHGAGVEHVGVFPNGKNEPGMENVNKIHIQTDMWDLLPPLEPPNEFKSTSDDSLGVDLGCDDGLEEESA